MNRKIKKSAIGFLVVGWLWAVGSPAAVAQPADAKRKETPSAPAEESEALSAAQKEEEAMRGAQQMMGLMMGQMIEGMARTVAKPEIAEAYAAFTRNYYLALVKKGFSEEEALKIVAATGLPSMGGGR